MDCSPPGSSVPGISQARILEQVAILVNPGIKPHLLYSRQSHWGSPYIYKWHGAHKILFFLPCFDFPVFMSLHLYILSCLLIEVFPFSSFFVFVFLKAITGGFCLGCVFFPLICFNSLKISIFKASCSRSFMSGSLRPHGLQPTSLLCPWDFPGKNAGEGSHSLLQGIFPTQGLNRGFLHCRQILYHLSHQGSPGGRWARERQILGGCYGSLWHYTRLPLRPPSPPQRGKPLLWVLQILHHHFPALTQVKCRVFRAGFWMQACGLWVRRCVWLALLNHLEMKDLTPALWCSVGFDAFTW